MLRLSRAEIASAAAGGRRVGNRDLSLRFVTYPGGEAARLAFVVSGREVKTAVARHRLKRRLRAIASDPTTKIKPGRAIVVFAGRAASTWTFNELKNNLINLFNAL